MWTVNKLIFLLVCAMLFCGVMFAIHRVSAPQPIPEESKPELVPSVPASGVGITEFGGETERASIIIDGKEVARIVVEEKVTTLEARLKALEARIEALEKRQVRLGEHTPAPPLHQYGWKYPLYPSGHKMGIVPPGGKGWIPYEPYK